MHTTLYIRTSFQLLETLMENKPQIFDIQVSWLS